MPLEGHFGSLPERDRSAEIPIRRGKYIDVEVFGELFATSGTFDSVTISNATITSATITGSVTVGSITINGATGQITLGSNAVLDDAGYIAFGSTPPTSYGNNVGIWIGDDAGTGKASFYSDASNYLQWNGSALALSGAVNATSGTLGTLTITGDLTLSGGKFATAASGQRVEITDGDRIRYYTGLVAETNYGYILADNTDTSNPSITVRAPSTSGTGHQYEFKSNGLYVEAQTGDTNVYITAGSADAYFGLGGTPTTPIVLAYDISGGTNGEGLLVQTATGTDMFNVENNSSTGWFARFDTPVTIDEDLTITNGVIDVPDGSFSATAYSFTNDAAMGMYKEGTDILGLASGTGGKGLSLGDGYLKIHRKNADTTEGGELQFEGGTSYANAMYIDRHQNNIRMVYNAAEKFRLLSTGDVTTIGALRAGAVGGTLTAGSLYSIPQTSASPAPGAGSQAKWILATGSTYYLARYTSSARYKKDIKPWDGRERVTDIDVMSFIGANRKPVLDEDGEVVEWVEEWGDTPVIGAIAEQVARVYPQAAVYDEDGRPESIDTDAVLWGMLHEIKQLRYEAEQWKKLKVGECRCNCGV